jgi:hypothetical protein
MASCDPETNRRIIEVCLEATEVVRMRQIEDPREEERGQVAIMRNALKHLVYIARCSAESIDGMNDWYAIPALFSYRL